MRSLLLLLKLPPAKRPGLGSWLELCSGFKVQSGLEKAGSCATAIECLQTAVAGKTARAGCAARRGFLPCCAAVLDTCPNPLRYVSVDRIQPTSALLHWIKSVRLGGVLCRRPAISHVLLRVVQALRHASIHACRKVDPLSACKPCSPTSQVAAAGQRWRLGAQTCAQKRLGCMELNAASRRACCHARWQHSLAALAAVRYSLPVGRFSM